ncbi:MAG: MarR family winged helix-turn-helix transcriptional regulator [Streptosporangiaceae bacterium]
MAVVPQDTAQLEPDPAGAMPAFEAATRVLAGLALKSMDVLDGAVSLPQFRLLAVLADLGRLRSTQAARALGQARSTVTRLAGRMVAAGYVLRGADPAHRSVVTLELTASGQDIVRQVTAWRHQELAAILDRMPDADRAATAAGLAAFVRAAGDGYGLFAARPVPV